jgi:hypothetical protein
MRLSISTRRYLPQEEAIFKKRTEGQADRLVNRPHYNLAHPIGRCIPTGGEIDTPAIFTPGSGT